MLEKEETAKSRILIDKFQKEYLPQKYYYRHSDIDLYVNLTITQILNFKTLLTDELNLFIQENYSSNYNYYEDLKEEKEKLLKQYFSQNIRINDNKAKFKDSLLSYDFPEFEIYFIAKLFVDGMERKPECSTKLLFNSKNINQYISMRFKYKDLTIDSYILLELYSMQIPEENNKNLLATTKIYFFNDNLNLGQGRHVFKLDKVHLDANNEKNENEINNDNSSKNSVNGDEIKFENLTREDHLDEVGVEIDSLINYFYGPENEKSIDYYGNVNESQLQFEQIDIKPGEKFKNMNEKYYFNRDLQKPIIKTEKMLQFDRKLEELLKKTENSYIVVKFPSFKNKVVYEEAISKNYIQTFKNVYKLDYTSKYIADFEKKKIISKIYHMGIRSFY